MKPIHGWIFIIVKDLEKNIERIYVKEANPFAEFIISLPEKYEIWAIGVANGKNIVYNNLRYARILLVRKPLI